MQLTLVGLSVVPAEELQMSQRLYIIMRSGKRKIKVFNNGNVQVHALERVYKRKRALYVSKWMLLSAVWLGADPAEEIEMIQRRQDRHNGVQILGLKDVGSTLCRCTRLSECMGASRRRRPARRRGRPR